MLPEVIESIPTITMFLMHSDNTQYNQSPPTSYQDLIYVYNIQTNLLT